MPETHPSTEIPVHNELGNKLSALGEMKENFLGVLDINIHQWLYLSFSDASSLKGLSLADFVRNKLPEMKIDTSLFTLLNSNPDFQTICDLKLSEILDISAYPDHRSSEAEKLATESLASISGVVKKIPQD